MVRAVAWNAAAKLLTQIFASVSTILVARLLSPRDYGLFGMATVYLCFAGIFDQFGIADAILTLRDISERQIAELNTIAVIQGICLFGVSCGIASPLSHFFREPRLAMVVVVSSATYVVNAFQVIPSALLRRNLRFKLLAAIETTKLFAQMVSVLILAWLGFAYWSLAYGYIVATVVATFLTLLWCHHSFAIPDFPGLRRELSFSGEVIASGIGWYLYSNGDFLIAGRMLGTLPLGAYTVAWNISTAPIEKIGNLITRVTPAFFAAIQNDHAELRRYFLGITEVISYVTVPASVGIALLADLLVPALLGVKWLSVIGPLRLLSIFVAYRSLNTILPKLLTAIGDTRFVMWASISSAIVMPFAFFVGSRWGTNGIAAAWIVMYPVITAPMYRRAFKRIELGLGAYISSVLPAINASAIMALVVFAARATLSHPSGQPARLLFLICIGAASYGGALLLFYGERVRRLLRAIRKRQDATSISGGIVSGLEGGSA